MKYYVMLNTAWPDTGSVQADLKGIDRINYGSNQQLIAHLSFLMKQNLPPPAEETTSALEGMKDRILDALQKKPGQGLAGLADSLGEEKRIVQPVLRLLVEDRSLKTKGERRGTKYYTADTDLRKFKGK